MASYLGSGGGWNSSLSHPANWTQVYKEFWDPQINYSQPTGYSYDFSWMGGFPCSHFSQQMGGFGGGGAGCRGGGGGGGFVGGQGGNGGTDNGRGGWSYYNPEAVLRILNAGSEFAAVGRSQNIYRSTLPQLWQHQGPGSVHILPALLDAPCQVRSIIIP